MNSHISITEAVKRTGKSLSTITRIAKKYRGSEYIKKEGRKYLVAVELLKQLFTNYSDDYSNEYSKKEQKAEIAERESMVIAAKNETIYLLKNQLDEKHEMINSLLERQREANIIIKGLQEQIKLPEKTEEKIEEVEEIKEEKKEKSKIPVIVKLKEGGLSSKEIAATLNQCGLVDQYGKPYTEENVNIILEFML